MMANILILSAGRRTELVKYFKKEWQGFGKVFVSDCSKLAAAIFFADDAFIVPQIYDENYIGNLIDICLKNDIKAVFSLIDPELDLLAQNKELFLSNGITPIVSDFEMTNLCFDKMKFYEFLKKNNYKCALTYDKLSDFEEDLEKGKIAFPVFVKPNNGSASININVVNNMETLKIIFNNFPGMIIQEYLKGQEIGADLYADLISKETVSIFTKEKIAMRAGETDKSISFKDEKLFAVLEKLAADLKVIGQIDVDIFRVDGEYYISEINPRFGGGYPHAYNCGANFPALIRGNLKGNINKKDIGNYESGIYMIKHDTVCIFNEKATASEQLRCY